ncbi:MAG TPA: hypothetical protein PKD10_19140 [Paracoccaceae bacterium]|nr:hypothetical protein [Paracoccaceae bacterium]HMO72653.1 hypothetical protein [Paracoccaceae bacterium]
MRRILATAAAIALAPALTAAPAAALGFDCVKGREAILPEGYRARVVGRNGPLMCVMEHEEGSGVYMRDEIAPLPRDDPHAGHFIGDFACQIEGDGPSVYGLTFRGDGTYLRSDGGLAGTWRMEAHDSAGLFIGRMAETRVMQQSDGVTFVDPETGYIMACAPG